MRWVLAVAFLVVPSFASAQVSQFVFTTAPQTVAPNVSTEQITLEAQDAAGQPVSGSTVCIRLTSSASDGMLSTNASWSDPLPALTLTLSSNQARRNFYYKGSASGVHTLTAQAAIRPDSGTCSQWSPENSVGWTTSQDVAISGAGTGGNAQASTSTTTNTSSTSASSQNAPVSSYVPPPVPTLFADGGDDRTVIVGADVEFNGRAYNREKELVAHVRYLWNFGDGTQSDGPAVLHHYQYPGRYAVVLTIAENLESSSDHFIVTAEPAKLSFEANPDGSVTIGNLAGRDLDLSRWLVRSFGQFFVLPENSIILSGERLRIAQKTLKFYAGADTELDYPNGAPAVISGRSTAGSSVAPAPAEERGVPAGATRPSPVHVPISKKATADADDAEPASSEGMGTSSATSAAQVASAAAAFRGGYWWLAALALALSGAGAVVLVRHIKKDEWDITEAED